MTREELRDWAILGRIVERVEEQKQFCGETLLQKSAYCLKEMFDAPISAPFRIYYYGAFSFDLRETLSTMKGLDVVRPCPTNGERHTGSAAAIVRSATFPQRCNASSQRSIGSCASSRPSA